MDFGDVGVPRDTRPSVKVILVGISGVGKTCLIEAYTKKFFDRMTAPTVAPAFSCRPVKRKDGSLVVLQIWDTAGQERYSSISQLFFRDSEVALLCFDPTDQLSITGLKEWVHRIAAEVATCRLMGVMTKADKIEKEKVQVVLEESKQKLALLIVEQYFVTSAIAMQGIEEPFAAAAECASSAILTVPPTPVEKKACC
jgi:small GTP-binding protein